MLTIMKPYIQDLNDKSRCICNIDVDGNQKTVWFEVNKKYRNYLVTERADAYVIGLLHWCMQNNHNIKCEIPTTDELLYNIRTILIPSLSKANSHLKRIDIISDMDTPLKGKEIGTGCSCGIDSFDAIYMHYKTKYKNMDLTYLCINNVGAFNECYDGYGKEKVKEERYKKVDEVAEELGLPIIKTDSNFAEAFSQVHLYTHTYSSVFAIYMLQKLWRIYYYASSGIDYGHFSMKDEECAHYELLSLQCFSTSGLRIYSEGGEKQRLDKTKDIVDFRPAQKYLHVCLTKPTNCGICSKCRRTLLTLDMLGKLDNFKESFDIEYYRSHKKEYYKWLALQHLLGDEMNEPIYRSFKKIPEFRTINWMERFLYPLKKIKWKLMSWRRKYDYHR